jgi:hypothetical protein
MVRRKNRYHFAEDILGVLREHKFYLMHEQGKLPCVIIANLVTPKRDPQGQDKSRISRQGFRRNEASIKARWKDNNSGN